MNNWLAWSGWLSAGSTAIAMLALFLFGYLLYALLRAERF